MKIGNSPPPGSGRFINLKYRSFCKNLFKKVGSLFELIVLRHVTQSESVAYLCVCVCFSDINVRPVTSHDIEITFEFQKHVLIFDYSS